MRSHFFASDNFQGIFVDFGFLIFTQALMKELASIFIYVHKIFNCRVSFKILLSKCHQCVTCREDTLNKVVIKLHVPNHTLKDMYMLNYGAINNTNSLYSSSKVLIDSITNNFIAKTFFITVYPCNCQGNTIFSKHKLFENKEAEVSKKQEQIKKMLRVESSNTENYNNNQLYFFCKFAYKKVTWHIHTTSI